MNILLVLIPISLLLVGFAVWALVWAVRRGQFDDLDTPAMAILADDDLHRPQRSPSQHADVESAPLQPTQIAENVSAD